MKDIWGFLSICFDSSVMSIGIQKNIVIIILRLLCTLEANLIVLHLILNSSCSKTSALSIKVQWIHFDLLLTLSTHFRLYLAALHYCISCSAFFFFLCCKQNYRSKFNFHWNLALSSFLLLISYLKSFSFVFIWLYFFLIYAKIIYF